MKRVFIDANVILDALLLRKEHGAAGALLKAGEQRRIRLLTTPLSIGMVIYNYQKNDTAKKGPRLAHVKEVLQALLACVEVVPMDAAHFQQSAASTFGDIEDGAQYFAVTATGPLDGVVSRDKDFDGHIAVKRLTAADALRLVK
jgi:predicted nucleic acid-binding protein